MGEGKQLEISANQSCFPYLSHWNYFLLMLGDQMINSSCLVSCTINFVLRPLSLIEGQNKKWRLCNNSADNHFEPHNATHHDAIALQVREIKKPLSVFLLESPVIRMLIHAPIFEALQCAEGCLKERGVVVHVKKN